MTSYIQNLFRFIHEVFCAVCNSSNDVKNTLKQPALNELNTNLRINVSVMIKSEKITDINIS